MVDRGGAAGLDLHQTRSLRAPCFVKQPWHGARVPDILPALSVTSYTGAPAV